MRGRAQSPRFSSLTANLPHRRKSRTAGVGLKKPSPSPASNSNARRSVCPTVDRATCGVPGPWSGSSPASTVARCHRPRSSQNAERAPAYVSGPAPATCLWRIRSSKGCAGRIVRAMLCAHRTLCPNRRFPAQLRTLAAVAVGSSMFCNSDWVCGSPASERPSRFSLHLDLVLAHDLPWLEAVDVVSNSP